MALKLDNEVIWVRVLGTDLQIRPGVCLELMLLFLSFVSGFDEIECIYGFQLFIKRTLYITCNEIWVLLCVMRCQQWSSLVSTDATKVH